MNIRDVPLPPLANVFAFHHADPARLADAFAGVQNSGEFEEVWRPASGWIAASLPLPCGAPDDRQVRAAGFLFAEGRDALYGSSEARNRLSELSDVVSRTPERLAAYAGDFGFLQFQADGAATVVRSCGGLVPFYLHQSDDCVAVSTRLGDMVRFLPVEPPLDHFVNAVWTSGHGVFPDGRTFLAGVSILARGHYARIGAGRPITRARYWDPRRTRAQRPTVASIQEHAERLRGLLVGSLARDLHPAGGNLLTLSGGVDSSALAALAVTTLGRRISTFSVMPSNPATYAREMSYIDPLAERCHFKRRWQVRVEPDAMVRLLSQAPRIVFHVIHPALCALPGIVREWPVRVLFGGEFADEVCGSARTLPDWAAATSAFRFLGELRRGTLRKVEVRAWLSQRRWQLLRRPLLPLPAELPEFIRAELRDEYTAWLEKRRREAYAGASDRRYLEQCTLADGSIPMNWEAASAVGVRRSIPFFTREMLELAFECHSEELVGGGDKKLLRSALRDDVPVWNLDRADKGSFGLSMATVRLPWAITLPPALDGIVRPDWFPQPPASVSFVTSYGLQQLVVFAESVAVRRMARPS